MSGDFTKREMAEWQRSKNRLPVEREELDYKQKKIFLKLIAELRSPAYFERELNMNRSDIEYFKRELDIQSQDEARRALRKLNDNEEADEVKRNMRQSYKAEAIANKRLQEYETKQREKEQIRRELVRAELDPLAIKKEDAVRQRRFEKQEQDALQNVKDEWKLPLDGIKDAELIELFKNDISHRGMNFCINKYNASSHAIKAEAIRLNLDVDWDRVTR
jgi:hypothetical protein